jgi:hypothetical protein
VIIVAHAKSLVGGLSPTPHHKNENKKYWCSWKGILVHRQEWVMNTIKNISSWQPMWQARQTTNPNFFFLWRARGEGLDVFEFFMFPMHHNSLTNSDYSFECVQIKLLMHSTMFPINFPSHSQYHQFHTITFGHNWTLYSLYSWVKRKHFSNFIFKLQTSIGRSLQSCRRFASMIVHGAIHGWLGQRKILKSLDKSNFPLFHHAWRLLLRHVYKRNGYKSRNKELLYEVYANCSLYTLKLLLIKSLQLVWINGLNFVKVGDVIKSGDEKEYIRTNLRYLLLV